MARRQARIVDFFQTPISGKQAAIYIRVSRNEFNKGTGGKKEMRQSVKSQRKNGIDYAKKQRWKYELYDNDCDMSGHSEAGEFGRQDLQRLLNDIDNGLIHTVIVRDPKRLFRHAYLLKGFVHEHVLPHGVNLIGLETTIDITTQQGRTMLGFVGEMAESEWYEYRRLSMQRREEKAKDGTLALNPYTFGYRSVTSGVVDVVEEEVDTVKRIYALAIKGLSTREIADKLNEEGRKTKYGHTWQPTNINRVVANPRYITQISYNKKICASPFPRIVTDGVWKKANAIVHDRSRPRTRTNSKYLLSGIVKCPKCLKHKGKKNVSENLTITRTVNGERVKYYYVCQTMRKHGKASCTGTSIGLNEMDMFVQQFIGALAYETYAEMSEGLSTGIGTVQKQIDNLEKRIGKLEQKKNSLVQRFDENTDDDIYFATVESISNKIVRAKNELHKRRSEMNGMLTANHVDALDELHGWTKLSFEDKRRALRHVMPQILVYGDRVEIYLCSVNSVPIIVEKKQRLYKGYRGHVLKLRTKRRYLPDKKIDKEFFKALSDPKQLVDIKTYIEDQVEQALQRGEEDTQGILKWRKVKGLVVAHTSIRY